MFWGYFKYAGPGTLVPDDGTMNALMMALTMNYIKYIKIRVILDKMVCFMQTFANGVGVFQHELSP